MLALWIHKAFTLLLSITMSDSAVREFTQNELDILTTAKDILARHIL